MQRLGLIAVLVLLGAGCGFGQDAGVSTTPSQPERVKVYSGFSGVAAPVLLPLAMPPLFDEKCGKKVNGDVRLSLLVDSRGRPRNIMFLKPLGTDLDRLALQIAGADRFAPGTMDGNPVVVAGELEVRLRTCIDESADIVGATGYRLRLSSAPSQEFRAVPGSQEEAVLSPDAQAWGDPKGDALRPYHVGGGVTAPRVLNFVEAKYSEEGRKKNINGVCWISMTVDAQGMPQNARVTKSLGYGLDEQALAAVNEYRFKPAMIENGPVPVMITVEVNFRLYHQ